MNQQAEVNRSELGVLYTTIRDLLIQREQSLKTYIAEVFLKEEQACLNRVN